MGLVKTRRLAAMHKQERAKAGMKPRQLKVTPPNRSLHLPPPYLCKTGGRQCGQSQIQFNHIAGNADE